MNTPGNGRSSGTQTSHAGVPDWESSFLGASSVPSGLGTGPPGNKVSLRVGGSLVTDTHD